MGVRGVILIALLVGDNALACISDAIMRNPNYPGRWTSRGHGPIRHAIMVFLATPLQGGFDAKKINAIHSHLPNA